MVGWQSEFTTLLNESYQSLLKKNSRLSVRVFAKKLGLSPGSLSEILRGKDEWQISAARAAKILEKLELRPSVRNRLLVRMAQPPVHKQAPLPPANYDFLTDWTYSSVLCSFDLPTPHRQPEAIAKRLGVTETKVKRVIEDLARRGALIKSEDGSFHRPENFVQTSDGIPNAMIRKHHETGLSLAKRALEELPVERRDFTSLTFAGSEKQLKNLVAEIRKLHERASALMNAEEQNDGVFRLSIQLYPTEFKRQCDT